MAEKEEEEKTRVEQLEEECAELRRRLRGLLPEEFVSHVRAARKEMLLAVRSLLDAKLERLEEAERRRAKRATKVPVE